MNVFLFLFVLLLFICRLTLTDASQSQNKKKDGSGSLLYLRRERQLQSPEAAQATSCPSSSSSAVIAQNTTYNADPLVPPYQGIMFEVVSQGDAPIEILTLEIDVRLDQTDDLYIQVYSLMDKFELFMDDESAWTLHAQTIAVPAPQGTGVIIPRHDFVPITMQPHERRSFFIHMNGPWLDHSASHNAALIKTGEVFLSSPNLDFYAGVGFLNNENENEKFTATFDTTVDPQFSGVVYYHKPQQANNNKCPPKTKTPHITHASFEFLTTIPVTSAIMSKVNAIVNNAIDEHIMSTSTTTSSPPSMFAQYMAEFGFQRHDMATTTTIPLDGTCPVAAWGATACSTVDTAMTTHVSFIHLDTLSSSDVLERFYYSPFPQQVLVQALVDGLDLGNGNGQVAIAGDTAAAPVVQEILSIGLNSAWVNFTMTLHGVAHQPTSIMDTLQQGVWEHSMLQFLNTTLATRTMGHVQVYKVHVTGQKPIRAFSSFDSSRFLQEQQPANSTDNNNATTTTGSSSSSSSIQLTGFISGAQNAYLLADNFAHHVAMAIKDDAAADNLYLAILQASILRPYQVNDTGLYDYFVNVTGVTGDDIVPAANPPPYMVTSQPKEEKKQVPILPIAIVFGILGFVVFVAVIYYLRKYRIEKAAYKRELQEYRQEMKQERQKRRAAATGAGGGVDDPSPCGSSTVQTGSNRQQQQQQQPNGNNSFVPCSTTAPPPPAQASSSSSSSRTSKNSSESQSTITDTNKIPARNSTGAPAALRRAKEQEEKSLSTSRDGGIDAKKGPPRMTPGRSKSSSSGDPSANKELAIRGIRSASLPPNNNPPSILSNNRARQAPGRSQSDTAAGPNRKDAMAHDSKSNIRGSSSNSSPPSPHTNPRQSPRRSQSDGGGPYGHVTPIRRKKKTSSGNTSSNPTVSETRIRPPVKGGPLQGPDNRRSNSGKELLSEKENRNSSSPRKMAQTVSAPPLATTTTSRREKEDPSGQIAGSDHQLPQRERSRSFNDALARKADP